MKNNFYRQIKITVFYIGLDILIEYLPAIFSNYQLLNFINPKITSQLIVVIAAN